MNRLLVIGSLCVVVFMTALIACADELEDAAAKGDVDAQLKLGLQLLSDTDTKNNIDGVKWLEMSAAGGNIVADYNLGAIHQDGTEVKKDANKAMLHLSIAAELGEVRAMNRLAGIYFKGEIVPQNDILAVKWAIIAAGLGSETAQKNVERMKPDVSERDRVLGGTSAQSWVKRRSAILFPKNDVPK